MADPMTPERLAAILWTARKRALGYSTLTPLAELPADLQSDYRRFAAEVAKLLDQDRDTEVERLRAALEQAQTTITGLNRKLKVEEIHYRQSQRARREAEAERDGARADRGLLAEQIRRVRAAHPPEDNLGRWTCGTCLGSDEEQMPYPCLTIRALGDDDAS